MFAEGTRIGKYELKRLLGQGGFGMVFIARDTALDRECALKFLLSEHTTKPEILQRFLQEARSAAKIDHLGIVTVFECGQVTGTNTTADGTAFIAMELLKGESLASRLEARGAMPPGLAITFARQIASALSAAHKAGIVHRDLKPDNVFLVSDVEASIGERVKVLDFGIAKLGEGQVGGAGMTGSMMIFGTPRYMSPEQCRSSANVTASTDIYALGVILYEMLTGLRPFEGEPGALIAMHQVVPPPPLRSRRPDLAPELEALVMAMLAKTPEGRPRSMDELIQHLEAIRTGRPLLVAAPPSMPHVAPVAAIPPTLTASAMGPAPVPAFTPPPPMSRPVRAGRSRLPLILGGAGAAVAIAVVVAVVAFRGGRKPAPVIEAPKVEKDHDIVAFTEGVPPMAVVFADSAGVYTIAKMNRDLTEELSAERVYAAHDKDSVRDGMITAADLKPDEIRQISLLDEPARTRATAEDDPPPPKEEDKPDDGADESGGTGTAMALDEGKMGKKDSDRAEGQYKMQSESRRRSQLESPTPNEGWYADRLGGGAAISPRDLGPFAPMIAAAPNAPASSIARLTGTLGASLVVTKGGKLGLFFVAYAPVRHNRGRESKWIEVHVDDEGVHVVRCPDIDETMVKWRDKALDRDGFAAALAKAREGGDAGVDVLVPENATATAQQLIDVLVAAHDAKAVVGVGLLSHTSEWRVKGIKEAMERLKKQGTSFGETGSTGRTAAVPTVSFGGPIVLGDLDKAIVSRYLKRNAQKFQYCYEKELLAKTTLQGTVNSQFAITGKGTVSSAVATGVDPAVSNCVADVLRQIEFPAPKGGSTVQVNHSMVFRPAGG